MAIEWEHGLSGAAAHGLAPFRLEVTKGPTGALWFPAVLFYGLPVVDIIPTTDLESAKLAAVEAWRRWAREQAEAAGWEVKGGS